MSNILPILFLSLSVVIVTFYCKDLKRRIEKLENDRQSWDSCYEELLKSRFSFFKDELNKVYGCKL